MEKIKLRFFLDYGTCFWTVDITRFQKSALTLSELPLTLGTRQEISEFLYDFDQSYFCSCPPSEGWTVEDCKRFNTEMWRIFKLAESELRDQYIICQEQPELMEDEELLAQFYSEGEAFHHRKVLEYFGPDEED